MNRTTWVILLIVIFCYSCAGVSISTTTANPPKGTISIANFLNEASGGPPDLSQRFTEDLKEFYLRNAKGLDQVNSTGDYQLEGYIQNYSLEFKAPTSNGTNESAGLTRLNITVVATYIDTKKESNGFENKQFRFYSDFDSDKSLSEVEEEVIDEIFSQLTLDIFNACYDNDEW